MEIIEKFLQIAKLNTENKLEFCSVLCGIEEDNQFIVNSLVVPRQEGATDHCYMTDEMSLFEAQIKHSILTIGWIHTHPQFDIFLSSVDLHNQLGYQ